MKTTINRKEQIKANKRKYYQENKEKERNNMKIWYQNNKQLSLLNSKKYQENNKEKISNYNKSRYLIKKKLINEYNKRWKRANPAKVRTYNVKRHTALLQRFPKWLTIIQLEQIEIIYKMSNTIQKLTNIKTHVDHIIPLQGKTASGLHTPSNLQIVTAKYNLTKNNNIT